MGRLKFSRGLFALAVLAMPLSYGVKNLLALDAVWVNPTLLLGLIIFVLMKAPVEDKTALWLVLFTFVSAFCGSFLMSPVVDSGKSPAYVTYVEPIRLTLNVIWFWVCIRFLKLDRQLVIRWLVACVLLEFGIAAYLYMGLYDLVPTPDIVHLYLEMYKTRQAILWGDITIYRMAGTFDESPLFGVFEFSCFVPLFLEVIRRRKNCESAFWPTLAALLAFTGAVASISDQVLVALFIFCMAVLWFGVGGSRSASPTAVTKEEWAHGLLTKSILVILTFALFLYVGSHQVERWQEQSSNSSSASTAGQSTGERLFHTKYALGLFLEQPISVVVGIGSGRYGNYVGRTGIYQSTVTPQVTPVEWLVEGGIVGMLLVSLWLFQIGQNAARVYGRLGTAAVISVLVANSLQGVWKWESWFLCLAFLFSSGCSRDWKLSPAPNLQEPRSVLLDPNGA